jgi:hypothetical protein
MAHNIEIDGLNVLINKNGRCVARFCQSFREYNVHWKKPQKVLHSRKGTTLEDWESFVSVVMESFDISIDNKYKPIYILETV